MKISFRLSVLSAALLALASVSRAQTPYLETASLSFLTSFTTSGVASTATSLVPVVPDTPGAIDPDKVRPVDRITVDIGSPIVHPLGNGDQSFFTKQLVRVVMEEAAEEYKSIAQERDAATKPTRELIAATEDAISELTSLLVETTDPDTRAALTAQRDTLETELASQESDLATIESAFTARLAPLESRIGYLKVHGDGRWELTAVRSAQSSVAGVISTPYTVFLTRIERTAASVSRSFDTGLRLVPIQSAGTSSETLSNGRVTSASGSYTTHFRLDFASFYATDPLSKIEADDRAKSVDGTDYNTAGDAWIFGGTGYMSYRIRSTPGPLAAVAPADIKISGHGSWTHLVITPDNIASFGGIAPFAIKMGDVKFQNRNLFPDFAPAD